MENEETSAPVNAHNLSEEHPEVGVEIATASDLNKLRLDDSEQSVITGITDGGKFSITVLSALALHHLFDNKWDAEFCEKCVKNIVRHLKLSEKVESMAKEVLNGVTIGSSELYIQLLEKESLNKNKLRNNELILQELILLAVESGKYDSRWRVLVIYLGNQLKCNTKNMNEFESTLINHILQRNKTEEEEKNERRNRRIAKTKRYGLIGLVTLGGGALIGLSGGLAAPLISAGLTSIVGTSAVFTALGTGVGATIFGSLFGVAGGGLTGYKMQKRIGGMEEFEFHYLNSGTSDNSKSIDCVNELHLTIALSGWIEGLEESHYTKPWLRLCDSREQYYLRYESSYLLELGKAMDYIVSFGVNMFGTAAVFEALKLTVLSGLVSATMWPSTLLSMGFVIDNPWGVGLSRSAQVGKHLADVLLSRQHGQRPVSLIGYSLGARVIFFCLKEMSSRNDCEGIIQDVFLIGAPCTALPSEWAKFTRVVAGRIVNVYSRGDWLLRFMYRTLSVMVDGVAGMQMIELVDRRMTNVDVTDLISRHSDYPEKMTDILKLIGVDVREDEGTNNGEREGEVTNENIDGN